MKRGIRPWSRGRLGSENRRLACVRTRQRNRSVGHTDRVPVDDVGPKERPDRAPGNRDTLSSWDAATQLRDLGSGRWRAEVAPGYSIVGKTNGGYALALAAKAAVASLGEQTRHSEPLAIAGSYLASAPAEPVDLVVQVLRAGRSTSVCDVRMQSVDASQVYLVASVTCGALPGVGETQPHSLPRPADMPDPADCMLLTRHGAGFDVRLMDELEEYCDPAGLGWIVSRPRGVGEIRAWVRFVDGRQFDPVALVLAVDALPPATFDLGQGGWTPTIQLSALLRAQPAPGRLLVRQVARCIAAGTGPSRRTATVDETCDVWDSTGALVATGHQLAGLRLS